MPDQHPTAELLHALRTCWPKKQEVRTFRDEFGNHLDRSFTALNEFLGEFNDEHDLDSLDNVLSDVAVSLAIGYLTQRVKEDGQPATGETAGFSQLVNAAASHDGLRDVMLTVGCAMGDETCGHAFLEIVDRDVRPFLVGKWGVGKARPVIEDLPSHLLEPLKQGLNRGRIRLLTFYGRSSLATWLRTVAANRLKDREGRPGEVQPVNGVVESESGSDGESPSAAGTAVSVQEEQLRQWLAETATPVFKRLLQQLRQESIQQYYYAILRCVQDYSPALIAVRLRVSRPRVTQLSQAVCSKFLSLLAGEEPEFAEATNKLDLKTRHAIEEAIRDLLKADKELDEPFDMDDEPAGDAPPPRVPASPRRTRSKPS